ncbi:glycosyltransferase family 2 protein [Pseudoalteromonas sp. SR43-6]|uniref:glycosyltransferase family 2 protein n=1 Tax=unclassified Pseudoalteromonas TaxID=194690 RepID=UPI0015F8F507|nr:MULTISPECIES: glycosyltransferase family 2 protein [unclassified Pseudoalteromonas]MBB1290177.1 glycosyltransferase family 2 protein [Pseudoalteromonas sp. SR41-5]MBB1373826.1 glycosyltransferase family 2 protein [Pseudoalteromonas sp. SR43-6]MBB1412877.1 glycosyltransferase family 2 protein [Pseudoalteromonas sp. SG43-8]
MKNTVDVSVVIPCYNDSISLKRCIESIVLQSCLPKEVIIIDDFSDDYYQSQLVIDEMREKNKSLFDIKLFRNERNMNGAYSRNKGIDIARGQYVALLDADDYWLERHLELSFNSIISEGADFIYSNVVLDRGEQIVIREVDNHELLSNRYDTILLSPPQTNSFFFKREVFPDISFDIQLKRHQDYQFYFDILRSSYVAKYVNFSTAVYTVSHRDISTRVDYKSIFDFWERHQEYFSKKILQWKLSTIHFDSVKLNKSNGIDYSKYSSLCFLNLNEKNCQSEVYAYFLLFKCNPISFFNLCIRKAKRIITRG